MKKTKTKLLFTAFICLIINFSAYADGRVIRQNGNYVAIVDGSTVYSGSKYFDAINAAIRNEGSGGYIAIETSGTSGNDNGSLYAINPYPGQTLDFKGNTVNCTRDDLVVGIYARKRHGITIKNIRMTGAPRFGIWFSGCNNVTISGVNMQLSSSISAGDGIRVDAAGGTVRNFKLSGSVNIKGTKLHAVETYGVDGVNIGNVTTSNTGGCGVLLNKSKNCRVGTVKGTRNNENGGYATFRVANNNGKTTCKKVYSRDSGRGFFSVSGSRDCTVENVDIQGTNREGVYIQDSSNTNVLSGSISNSGSANVRIRNSSGCSVNANFSGSIASRAANNVQLIDNSQATNATQVVDTDKYEEISLEDNTFENNVPYEEKVVLDFISIYPNPSKGVVNIKFLAEKGEKKIEIHNLQGELIKAATTKKDSYVLNLEKKGMYLVKVTDASRSYYKKIIIE